MKTKQSKLIALLAVVVLCLSLAGSILVGQVKRVSAGTLPSAEEIATSVNLYDLQYTDMESNADDYFAKHETKVLGSSTAGTEKTYEKVVQVAVTMHEGVRDAWITYDISAYNYNTFTVTVGNTSIDSVGWSNPIRYSVYADGILVGQTTLQSDVAQPVGYLKAYDVETLVCAIPEGTQSLKLYAQSNAEGDWFGDAFWASPTLYHDGVVSLYELGYSEIVTNNGWFQRYPTREFGFAEKGNQYTYSNVYHVALADVGDGVLNSSLSFDVSDYDENTFKVTVGNTSKDGEGWSNPVKYTVFADGTPIAQTTGFLLAGDVEVLTAAVPFGTQTIKLMAQSNQSNPAYGDTLWANPILYNSADTAYLYDLVESGVSTESTQEDYHIGSATLAQGTAEQKTYTNNAIIGAIHGNYGSEQNPVWKFSADYSLNGLPYNHLNVTAGMLWAETYNHVVFKVTAIMPGGASIALGTSAAMDGTTFHEFDVDIPEGAEKIQFWAQSQENSKAYGNLAWCNPVLSIKKSAITSVVRADNAALTYGDEFPAITATNNVGAVVAGAAVYNDAKLLAGTRNYGFTFNPTSSAVYEAKTDSVSLTVAKATMNMSGVTFTDRTVEYDGSEKTLEISGTLPQGVSVSYEQNTLTECGYTDAVAKFTIDPAVADNYNAIPDMTARLTVKAPVNAELDTVSVSLGESLTVNYYIYLADGYTDAQMKFVMNGREVSVFGTATGASNDVGAKYVFSFAGVTPQCIGDVFTATLSDGGANVLLTDTYSVKEYLTDLTAFSADDLGMSTEKYSAMQTLVADLLVYGAASQRYVSYKTDALVDEGVTGATQFETLTQTDTALSTTTDESTRFTSAKMYIHNVNYLMINFKAASLDNLKVTVARNGGAAQELDIVADGSEYQVKTEGIQASAVKDVFTFTIEVDGNVVQTLNYSVKSFVYAKQNETSELGAFVRAMYNYGLSASAYNEIAE